jgi:hypothetical protein
MSRLVEIRSYNLLPGRRDEFHRLVSGHLLPMLARWQVDVVACGPSPHDEDSYYLIRSYAGLAERQDSQDRFYGSEEWRKGPREQIVSLIDSDTSIVIEMDEAVIDALRVKNAAA